MKRLAILGASGHGKVIADAALQSGWQEVVFYDDAWPELQINSHWPVVGNTESLLQNKEPIDAVIIAIGNNTIRQDKSYQLKQSGFTLATIVHPTAIVSQFAVMGQGSFVAAGAIVHVDAQIGNFAIINTTAVVEHDCVIGEASHISPSAALAGGVTVGDCSWVGINACIKQSIKIGNNVIIGAGSTVLNNLPDDVTVVGNPSRILNK